MEVVNDLVKGTLMKARTNQSEWRYRAWCLPLVGLLTLVAGSQLRAESLYALTANQQLISFDSASPSQLSGAYFVRNLEPGEQLLGIDYRWSSGDIVGLGSFGNVYALNPNNGVATMLNASPSSTFLNGTAFGMDFDPFSDTLRVVSNLGQNLTADPNAGYALSTENNLGYAAGDLLAGRDPNIQAIAFGMTSADIEAQLYALDSAHNTLAVESPADSGTLETEAIVALPSLRRFSGFDVSQGTGVAYVSAEGAQTGLFQVDLATGNTVFIGSIGAFPDNLLLYGLTAVPEPSTVALLLAGLGLAGLAGFNRARRS